MLGPTELRGEFDFSFDESWLDTSAGAPGARIVTQALREAIDDWGEGRGVYRSFADAAESSRAKFSRLINAPDAGYVASMPTLAEAAATVAQSLPVGARVVVSGTDFHSNLLPWVAVRSRGVRVDVVRPRGKVLTTEEFIAAIVPGVNLVAVSDVTSRDGAKLDVTRIVDRAQEVGARTFLNVTQSMGVTRYDVGLLPVDFLACHGYKFLLSPYGSTWMYVRDPADARLRPLAPTWIGAAAPGRELWGPSIDWAEDARRLDIGDHRMTWVGADAALDLIGRLDAPRIEEHCLSLAARFVDGARAAGFDPIQGEILSHIVVVPLTNPEGVQDSLERLRVRALVRDGNLRISVHGYCSMQDIDRALDALASGNA